MMPGKPQARGDQKDASGDPPTRRIRVVLTPEDPRLPEIVLEGGHAVTVGREPSMVDVALVCPGRPGVEEYVPDCLSRKHARLECVGGHVLVEDLGSANGTFIDAKKITPGNLGALRARRRLILGGEAVVYSMREDK